MGEIKPIETYYNGYRFRSRLEARWAVFFDVLGIKYSYEQEGYSMQYGIRYLPDFKLFHVCRRDYSTAFEYKKSPVFVEVKGAPDSSSISLDDKIKIEKFAEENDLIVFGNIPKDRREVYNLGWDSYLFNYRFLDGDQYPCFFSVHNGDIWLSGPDHNESYDFGSEEKINRALAIARMARFEN